MILYHAGLKWIPGGLLGVDVFFVISGFLITSLLLSEHDRSGRISLPTFWMRRVRRLLPALVLMLLFVAVTWGLLVKTDVLSLRRDVLFALGYGANWWFAFSGQGYFQSLAAPSPVLHTWSLAVEEQFYLIWPLVVTALLARGKRVGRWAAAGALLAAVGTLSQSLAGVWTDRLYYGTDTRAVPLLVGAALGAWYARRPREAVLPAKAQVAIQSGGLLAAAALIWAFGSLSGQSTSLYRGGFLVLAIGVALLIASLALCPEGPLARLLSTAPLRGIGLISYGLYLWHWPLFQLVNHARTGLSGGQLLAMRLGLTLTVALLSYTFVELPIRQRRLRLPRARVAAPIAIVGLVAVLVAATPPLSPTITDVTSASQAAAIPPQARVGTAASRQAGVGTTRVLMVGDSVAYGLGNALALTEKPYKVHIDNVGLWGCGVAQSPERRMLGQVSTPSSTCWNWPQNRAYQVAVDRPDLVVLLVGLWEVADQLHDGQWMHIGEPAFDAYLSSQLDRAIKILTSTGAPVALLTQPCLSLAESPDGSPYPEANPARVVRFNQLLVQAQRRHPTTTTIVDLNHMVCPGGKFTSKLDGVTIRTADGIHFTETPLPPLAKQLMPQLRKLGVEAHQRRTASARHTP